MGFEVRVKQHQLGDVVGPILTRWGATMEEVGSHTKQRHVVSARRDIARALAAVPPHGKGWSLEAIGRLLGRDGSTISKLISGKARS